MNESINQSIHPSQRAARGWAAQTLCHVGQSPELTVAAHVSGADTGEIITRHLQGLDTALTLIKQNVPLGIIVM